MFLLIAATVAAQTTAPSTAPSVAVDQSTPRGAIKVYFLANARGDGAALRGLLLGESPAQDHLIAAIADQKDADRVLTDAIAGKFPDEQNPDPRQAALGELPAIDAKIDGSGEQITGDTAAVNSGSGDRPFRLKRVDGKWRIPLEVLRQDVDPDKLEHAAHQIEIQVQAMRGGADDVAAGKYATRAEAVQGINQQMFSAALADHDATQPAAGPQ
jgi:hypothetical protein